MKPPPERHKKTKMKRAKRTASAVASHSFDVVREVSDVFGPLKSVVNSVGHAKDVYQVFKLIHFKINHILDCSLVVTTERPEE